MKHLAWLLVLSLIGISGPALAVDFDNNGVEGDETYVPGTFDEETDRDETVIFPTSADTWQVGSYPYWWHEGDMVYGVHDVSLGNVDHVDLTLKLSYNSLNGTGHVDLDFKIGGTTVGSLVLTAADGTGYVYASFDFPAMAPPFELCYYETNTVDLGLGSVSIDEAGLCSAVFSGEGTPVAETTWGKVKALFQ